MVNLNLVLPADRRDERTPAGTHPQGYRGRYSGDGVLTYRYLGVHCTVFSGQFSEEVKHRTEKKNTDDPAPISRIYLWHTINLKIYFLSSGHILKILTIYEVAM
eukprot:SAG31_NODE_230_length_19771_cov_90.041739_14_plen_104_part_00